MLSVYFHVWGLYNVNDLGCVFSSRLKLWHHCLAWHHSRFGLRRHLFFCASVFHFFIHCVYIYIYNLWFVLSYVRSCEAMGSSDSDSESSSKELVEVEEERPAGTAAGVLEPEPEDSLDSSSESVSAARPHPGRNKTPPREPAGGCGRGRSRERGRTPAGDRRGSPAGHRGRTPAGERRPSPAGHRGRSPAGERRRSPAGERRRSPVRDKRPATPERPPSKGKSKGKSKDGRYVRCPHCWQYVVNTQCSQEQHRYWSIYCNTWRRYQRGGTWEAATAAAERANRRRQERSTGNRETKELTEKAAPRCKPEKERRKKDKKVDKEKRKKRKRVSPSPEPRKPLGGKHRRPPSSDDEPPPKEHRSSSSKGWTKVWHWVKL